MDLFGRKRRNEIRALRRNVSAFALKENRLHARIAMLDQTLNRYRAQMRGDDAYIHRVEDLVKPEVLSKLKDELRGTNRKGSSRA